MRAVISQVGDILHGELRLGHLPQRGVLSRHPDRAAGTDRAGRIPLVGEHWRSGIYWAGCGSCWC